MATFTNQATLSYNNNTITSNIATGEIVEVLSASKNSIPTTYNTGEDIPYVISIQNSGTTALNNITVTDNLGAYTVGTNTVYPLNYKDGSVAFYINGELQNTTPTVVPGPPVQFTNITIPAGSNAMIIYEANVTQYAPLATDSTIVNEATIDGDGIATPVAVSDTITVAETPNLSINKAINPSTVTENSQVTYTFTILNYGNAEATAADNIILSDTFDPRLSNITVSLDGTALTPDTQYTYDEATGVFETVAGQITVPAATYTQNADGSITTTPGVTTLTVTGTI